MKTTVSIEIDTDRLNGFTDAYLAQLWHVAQANPVNGFDDPMPGTVAEAIGREIIRRFLAQTPPELYSHQGHHHLFGKHVLSALKEVGIGA